MTVEQIIDEPRDQFPIGMRVLAVDDDRICLALLENLLRKCQYHVTTTNEASMALKLLKENKDKFDLVISDVYMPDMDGFKLLELMGLEMDLPVIMLSENDDPRLVMKGISHGACDYLLKPIRFEELKNIWQHVIRRKRLEPKNRNVSNKQHHGVVEGGQGQTGMGSSDQTGKLNKKKKNRNADEDEDRDENTQENEDPAAQKKPRVVWSTPLHGKFVAAVNHLGVEKAVPKRILEFMNVEKLTRANVASHLQKYRLCLKKMSSVAGMDSSYLRMDSHNGLRNFNKLTGSQLQNAALRSFPHNGMLGRLNTPASLDIRGLSSSGMVQLGHCHNSSYPIVDRGKLQPVLLSGNESGSTLQGMPTSLEFGQLQDNKNPIQIREQLPTGDNSMDFPLSSGLSDAKVTSGGSSNSLFRSTIYPLILPGHVADAQVRGGFGNESFAEVASFGSKDSSHLPDHVRCEDKWSSAVQSFEIQSDTLSSHGPSKQDAFSCSSFRDNMLPMGQLIGNDFHDGSSVSSMPIQLQDPVTYLQCQAVPTIGNVAENMNFTLEQVWNGQKEGISNSSTCDFMNSSRIAQHITGQLEHSLDPNNTSFHSDVDANFDGPLPMLHNEVVKSAVDATVNSKQAYLSGLGKPLGNGTYNNFDSSEDLFDVLMKQE